MRHIRQRIEIEQTEKDKRRFEKARKKGESEGRKTAEAGVTERHAGRGGKDKESGEMRAGDSGRDR